MTPIEPEERLSRDPRYADDFAAARAAQPSDATLGRVELRLDQALRGGGSVAPTPSLGFGKIAWASAMLLGASAAAAVGFSDELRTWLGNDGEVGAAGRGAPTVAPEVAPVVSPPQPTPLVAPAPVTDATNAADNDTAVVAKPPARARHPSGSLTPTQATPSALAAPPAAASSGALAAQLDALDRGRVALRRGRSSEALQLAEALLADHPGGPLQPEARALRVEALADTGQLDLAVQGARDLIADPAHASRRGEWWRYLGDLERRRGDCVAAGAAYDEAMTAGLPAAGVRAVEAGRAACAGGDPGR